MDAIGVLHEKLVFGRRARVLAEELVKAIPDEGRYLFSMSAVAIEQSIFWLSSGGLT